jgi:GDP/GTP exchange factor Sec2p
MSTLTAFPPDHPSSDSVHVSSPCPQCGTLISASPPHAFHTDAQARIRDLEAQVKLLNSKAAAAVDKLADYEDEVRFLKAQLSRSQVGTGIASPPPENQAIHQQPQQQQQSRLSSLSSFLPGRRAAPHPNSNNIPPVPPPPNTLQFSSQVDPQFTNASTPNLPSNQSDLTTALEAERRARLDAESILSQTQSEIEDLTAKLFGEANEMVAAERRARAKLEERVAVLEKRDGDKRRRLDRLEKALERIERVRGMVGSMH